MVLVVPSDAEVASSDAPMTGAVSLFALMTPEAKAAALSVSPVPPVPLAEAAAAGGATPKPTQAVGRCAARPG